MTTQQHSGKGSNTVLGASADPACSILLTMLVQRRMNPRGSYSDDEEMIGSDLGSDVDDDLIDFGDVTPAAFTGWCKSPFLPFPTNSFN